MALFAHSPKKKIDVSTGPGKCEELEWFEVKAFGVLWGYYTCYVGNFRYGLLDGKGKYTSGRSSFASPNLITANEHLMSFDGMWKAGVPFGWGHFQFPGMPH